MQDRPVVVSNGSSTAIFGIVAIVIIAAVALFFWQPWNASNGPSHSTTIINQQPAGSGAAGGSGTSGGTSGGSSGTSESSGSGSSSSK